MARAADQLCLPVLIVFIHFSGYVSINMSGLNVYSVSMFTCSYFNKIKHLSWGYMQKVAHADILSLPMRPHQATHTLSKT